MTVVQHTFKNCQQSSEAPSKWLQYVDWLYIFLRDYFFFFISRYWQISSISSQELRAASDIQDEYRHAHGDTEVGAGGGDMQKTGRRVHTETLNMLPVRSLCRPDGLKFDCLGESVQFPTERIEKRKLNSIF